MDQKNRISVRINGKQKPIEPHSEKQTVAPQEDKVFQWVLPETNSEPNVVNLQDRQKQHQEWKKKKTNGQASKLPLHRKKKGYHRPGKRKNKKVVPKQQWLSGFSAIIVGVIMGMIVLTVFTNHHPAKQAGTNTQQTANQTGSSADHSKTAANLDLSLEMVQGAVFSSQADGQTAASDLQNKGYAAILQDKNNKVHLLIGVGVNNSQTDSLGKLYKQQGQDVWVKKYPVHVNGAQLSQQARVFLGDAKPVMTKLIKASVQGLTSGKATLSKTEWNGIENQLGQLTNEAGAKTKSLMSDLNAAAGGFHKYRKNADPSQLWQAQQDLLQAVVSYQNAGK